MNDNGSDSAIDLLAQVAGLQIPRQYQDGVAIQFAALMRQAELVMSFSLPDEVEPAPVFTP